MTLVTSSESLLASRAEGLPVRGGSTAVSIYVFIDALGWRLLERHPWFLKGLADVRAPVDTVLGYSCTCDPTILTGRLPREHGHFSFFRFDPRNSPFRERSWWGLLPRAVRDRGRVRSWLSRLERRRLGYTGYFHLYGVPVEWLPWFTYTETRDLYAPGGIIGGQPTVFDRLAEARVPHHVSDWRRGDDHNLTEAEAVARDGQHRCLYVYLSELDALLHADGTDSPRVTQQLRSYDEALRRLVSVAEERHGSARLHVFSDHGMTDVVGTSDLRCRVERLGLDFGTDYAAVYDSTLARFWFPNVSARELIHGELEREPHGRVLAPDELQALGCDFPDQRYGEVMLLLDPGYVFDPSFMGDWVPRGMHGYHPAHRDSTAAYLSSVPDITPPSHLADLCDLMLTDAGVQVRAGAPA